ncbi:unannotated protein [freshwater metagenome]|uniref:non-specific serine/threonine protein kinase n=1 Tax=freshwater metagenome TaxID=449393 RepID=A0A6J7ALI3_9ZZZZ|nr:protein kinase [Actinomycetota bacterium]
MLFGAYPYSVNSNVQPLKASDPTSFGGWKILGRLGEGGYSTIFLGEKKKQLAAIKMIRKELMSNTQVYERFVTEINNIEKLSHPGIAKFIEDDLATDVPFIAVEYIEGKTLEQKVIDEGPLSETEWLEYLEEVASALDYCHSKKITHKDVSPGNIILSKDGPKLIDFGISHRVDDPRVTQGDETVGTPAYMSPEHWAGLATNAMDIFSLGSTFIFAATGQPAFSGEINSQIQFSSSYLDPNFGEMTKTQKNLLTPLLYKKTEDRPSLSELISTINMIKETKGIGAYGRYLKRSEKKLIDKPRYSKRTRLPSKSLALGVALGLLSVVLFVYFISNSRNIETSSPEVVASPINSSTPLARTPSASPTSEPLSTYSPASANSVVKANLDKTRDAYYAGDYKSALKFALLAAAEGDAHGTYDVAMVYEKLNKPDLAITWYQKAIKLGYGDAFLNLGHLYIDQKKDAEGVAVLEAGVLRNHTGSMNSLAFYLESKGNIDRAKALYLQASKLGNAMSMYNYGFLMEEEGNKPEAKKWYLKSLDAGYTDAATAVGFLFEQEADWVNAKKYYEISAAAQDPYGMYNLAIALGNHFNDKGPRPCELLNKALSSKDLESDLKKDILSAIAKGCSSTSSSSIVNKSPSATPVLNSEKFTVSPPMASNVVTTAIFGRIFLDSLNYWRVILTNSKSETVPPITGVQFRLLGYPDAGWMGVPYKLKVEPSNGSVYAEVDDMMFSILFKNNPYCPEFRAVREENGKIVKIWEKTKPECATNYTP